MKLKDFRDIPDQMKAATAFAAIAMLISITALIVAVGHGNS